MRGLLLAAVAFITVSGAAHGLGVAAVALAALAALGVFAADVWYAPWKACGSCKGGKTHGSFLGITNVRGRCWKCKGAGQFPRLSVRILMPGTYREMKAGRAGRNH
jgi:hypothetical protein